MTRRAIRALHITVALGLGLLLLLVPAPVARIAQDDPTPPTVATVEPEPGRTLPAAYGLGVVAIPPLDGGNDVHSPTPWSSWSLIDLQTGDATESVNARTEPSLSMSVIKAWLAAEYLRLTAEQGHTPTRYWLDTLSTMLRDSDNDAADRTYAAIGGESTLDRMVAVCGTSGDTYVQGSYGWGSTYISAHDAALLGACVADGRAAGPQWTEWLLAEMRQIRGAGDFGIRYAFDDEEYRSFIAFKNGWDVVNGTWYVNCLALADTWVLAVETRSTSFQAGKDGCVSIARQLRRH